MVWGWSVNQPARLGPSDTGVFSSAEQKRSLRALVALVVGSMVGSGIFAIPSSFGQATGGPGAVHA